MAKIDYNAALQNINQLKVELQDPEHHPNLKTHIGSFGKNLNDIYKNLPDHLKQSLNQSIQGLKGDPSLDELKGLSQQLAATPETPTQILQNFANGHMQKVDTAFQNYQKNPSETTYKALLQALQNSQTGLSKILVQLSGMPIPTNNPGWEYMMQELGGTEYRFAQTLGMLIDGGPNTNPSTLSNLIGESSNTSAGTIWGDLNVSIAASQE